ncbi:MAG: hypothetical protein GXO64_03415 [Candidatus Micrarchaeota archaeon]|nr:hypothetical protein [Candidatus Micrarchaeota archaeon]
MGEKVVVVNVEYKPFKRKGEYGLHYELNLLKYGFKSKEYKTRPNILIENEARGTIPAKGHKTEEAAFKALAEELDKRYLGGKAKIKKIDKIGSRVEIAFKYK